MNPAVYCARLYDHAEQYGKVHLVKCIHTIGNLVRPHHDTERFRSEQKLGLLVSFIPDGARDEL